MKLSDQAFLEELRRDFLLEAEEHLETLVSGLLEAEKAPEPSEAVVEAVYRAAHSLKGAAQAVRMPEVASLCQSMESVFSRLKDRTLSLERPDYDLLQRALDLLSRLVGLSEGEGENPSPLVNELNRLAGSSGGPSPRRPSGEPRRPYPTLDELLRLASEEEGVAEAPSSPSREVGPEAPPPASPPRNEPSRAPSPQVTSPRASTPVAGPAASVPPPSRATRGAGETIRIGVSKVDALLLQAEELVAVKLALDERLSDLRRLLPLSETRKGRGRGKSVASSSGGEERARLIALDEGLRGLEKAMAADRRQAEGLLRNLLEGAKGVLMLPASTLLQGFPKMVRDLARDLGKEVELTLSGGEIEMDKRILEGMKDPLIHLVRNAVDHGVERPEGRRALGKDSVGRLALSVSHVEGGQAEIVLADDGAGIDGERLRRSAVKAALLTEEEALALSDEAALSLIFRSGLSTSPLITDVSGRGLGMAIVQEGVEALGGKISLQSERGRGTTFRIALPLTLATFRGVLVEEWDQVFVVPTSKVERVARIDGSLVRRVEGRELISLGGRPVALVRLGSLLGLAPAERRKGEEKLSVVVLSASGLSVAFAVDRVVGEQEVLLKTLGRQLRHVPNVAGATVLGSGRVVPVLNVKELLEAVSRGGGARPSPSEGEAERRRSVLVVEDSITSRALIRNILTSAGYDVEAAVDGQEAWELLSDRSFDIVVSDVEMPRMNGFELTAKIRGDASMADLPVVLVTSLDSPRDRERGIDAGADAYIVKSHFDQGNLIEVMGRLL
ncbi:hybrid sensor histidine kinase/response regulator [Aminirod propionatiphilus]|uniref:Hybrid sensor histidine kinase/response regulator n=1 Tax=Aminirod propionatiphilus TaxID=3415223 RepID=A0ACD1DXK4_9BACT|nr:hybrid sensor histidine kinase/response regulator [Synergistota bacterium]